MGGYRNPWVPRAPTTQYLTKRYGITMQDWWALYKAQGGVCVICGKGGRKLFVDHHHDLGDAGLLRGSVRGLTCWVCNAALQAFREDPELMRRAAEYLVNPPAWDLWPDEQRETP